MHINKTVANLVQVTSNLEASNLANWVFLLVFVMFKQPNFFSFGDFWLASKNCKTSKSAEIS